METKNLAIMFTDMKGFTQKTSTQSRKQLNYLLELQDEIVRPIIKKFQGRVVKTIGDAYMVVFESPTNAVLCGIKVQEAIEAHNVNAPTSDQFQIRLAINSGEVNVKDGDVFGEPVNVASRLEALAEPGEVYFSEAVYLAMNKNEIPTAEVGVRHLKGIVDEIKVYKVLKESHEIIRTRQKRMAGARSTAQLSKSAPGAPKASGKETKSVFRQWYLYLIIAALIILVTYLINREDQAVIDTVLDEPIVDTQPDDQDQTINLQKIREGLQNLNQAVRNSDAETAREILDQYESQDVLTLESFPVGTLFVIGEAYVLTEQYEKAAEVYFALDKKAAKDEIGSRVDEFGEKLIPHVSDRTAKKIEAALEE